MNRLLTLTLIGLAGLLASCGSSVTSSTQPDTNAIYTLVVSPIQFTLNSGDWSTVTATAFVSVQNGTASSVRPQPTIQFSSSDSRVTISPAGEVCAGQWDTRYLTCTPTVFPPGSANAGQLDIPTGYVTITAHDASHNTLGTSLVSIHERAASITLSAPNWGTRTCISQNPSATTNPPAANTLNQVQYVAQAVNAAGKDISGQIYANDYTWSVADSTVASASLYGYVIARNPGVTSVFAKLNGTVSAPLTFVTCPPASITLVSSPFTNQTPILSSATTDDLQLDLGGTEYMTAEILDTNGQPIATSSVKTVTSDTLSLGLSTVLPLTSKLSTNTAGHSSLMVACEPSTCNASVADFVLPTGATVTGQKAGFGYPIYSNTIGVTIAGNTGSTVLVTGTVSSADGVTPVHRLLAYDSASMAITHTVEIANTPNSLVISPNGAKAYIGDACPTSISCDGLVVVDLSSYQSTIQNFPVSGGISTDVVTGKVLAVSPDSRYVMVSDGTWLFMIDTTGSKVAVRYPIKDVNAATFAADGSNIWISSPQGVYTYYADAFVLTNPSTGVKALAWMPDGQSFFASGDQLFSYSTCAQQQLSAPTLAGSASGPINLDSTVMQTSASASAETYVFGLAPTASGAQWITYPVTTSAQAVAPVQSVPATSVGNVCLSTVNVHPPAVAASTLGCTAKQISFAPTLASSTSATPLPREFVTGVDSSCTPSGIHGYDVSSNTEIVIPTQYPKANAVIPLSGGVLSDGSELYFGSYDTTNGALLHRIGLTTNIANAVEDIAPVTVELVPSFVAVVPK